jgi:serine O-acetyltransferase
MLRTFKSDIEIIRERDPAARGIFEIFLCYPGFQSIIIHRFTHKLWLLNLPLIPRLLSHLNRLFTGIEIHPGAKIGKKVFIDHGMGVVIGETAEIGNNCLLYQGVTLGGTGKSHGKRHPTLMENVVVGAGAKVLGSIIIGQNTRIGAGSVVVRNVEENSTVVGIPGRVVHQSGVKINPLAHSALPDAEANVIKNLMDRIDQLENQILKLQNTLQSLVNSESNDISKVGNAQNLKDKEIIEFLGDN